MFICTLFYGCNNSTKSPNIVLIISDDQGYSDLSCMEINDDVSTPNIDKLTASGLRFTQDNVTSSICRCTSSFAHPRKKYNFCRIILCELQITLVFYVLLDKYL